jgi:hypothetical protein
LNPSAADVTTLLNRLADGDQEAAAQLVTSWISGHRKLLTCHQLFPVGSFRAIVLSGNLLLYSLSATNGMLNV